MHDKAVSLEETVGTEECDYKNPDCENGAVNEAEVQTQIKSALPWENSVDRDQERHGSDQ
jgi:hypothetical protein